MSEATDLPTCATSTAPNVIIFYRTGILQALVGSTAFVRQTLCREFDEDEVIHRGNSSIFLEYQNTIFISEYKKVFWLVLL